MSAAVDGMTPFPASFAARYRALGYDQSVMELVFHANAERVLGLLSMATLQDVRQIAMSLPRTTEHLIGDNTKFRVGRLVYASVSADEERLGFGFPKEERAALVASEPAKFMMPLPADERYQWVRARLATLDAEELRELLIDAWCMVVPKTIAARYLESQGLPPG